MAVAEAHTSPQSAQEKTWHGIVLEALKRNDIRLVPYVPDRVLTTLIKNVHADPFFTRDNGSRSRRRRLRRPRTLRRLRRSEAGGRSAVSPGSRAVSRADSWKTQ